MPFVTALLSFAARQLGTLVRVIFGWSVTTLFGKLSKREQTAISVALFLSVSWPVLVVGCFFPAVATWVIAFVPLHAETPREVMRVIWIILSILAPLVVGLLTWWVTPADKRRAPAWLTTLGGFVMVIGYAIAFVVTVITVPIVKLLSVARRWADTHVYMQSKEGHYEATLDMLVEACHRAGVDVTREDVPRQLEIATSVTRTFARLFVKPRNDARLQRLRGKGLQLYLYPADLMLRGAPETVGHVRAAMAHSDISKHAYLVESKEAQQLQDTLETLPPLRAIPDQNAKTRIADATQKLDSAKIPFDEWRILDAELSRRPAF